jgi:hypothetical protein
MKKNLFILKVLISSLLIVSNGFAQTEKSLAISKYNFKSINNVVFSIDPVIEKNFRNGDPIREARSPGEWEEFIKNKVPAYCFKDFTSENLEFGLIYNLYAFIDSREIAPLGSHKMTILEIDKLQGTSISSKLKKTVNCDNCEGGLVDNYVYCSYCNHWNDNQKEYNVCPKCNNNRYWVKGKKTCSECNGKQKYIKEYCPLIEKNLAIPLIKNMSKVKLPFENDEVLPFVSYLIDECVLEYNYGEGIEKSNFQFLLCKDQAYIKNEIPGTIIGDLEFMNTLLSVKNFRNGDPINYIEDNVEWELAIRNGIPAYCCFNNDKNCHAFIYNIHAWNDKRGLIPAGWRSLTSNDLSHLRSFLGAPFNLSLQISPFKNPKGFRDDYGKFHHSDYELDYGDQKSNENYFYHANFSFGNNENRGHGFGLGDISKNKSGYVLCVRDALETERLIISNNKKEFKPISNELISNSKLTYDYSNKNGEKIEKEMYWKSRILINDYNDLYNEYGQKILAQLHENDFNELFDLAGDLSLIGSYKKLKCEESYCCGYLDYLHNVSYGNDIVGIKLKRISKNNQTYLYAIVYHKDITMDKREKIIEGKLIQINETSFQIENDPKAKLVFRFDVNTCSPSDNPIDNFYVDYSNYTCGKPGWEKKLGGAYWGEEEKAALESVYSFLNNESLNFDKYLSISEDIENEKKEDDKAITNKIIENIKNDKFEEALKEFDLLSFPNEFPSEYRKLLNDKRDASNLKKIQEYLSNKQPDEAAKTYNVLYTKNADLKSNIQNALNQKYQNDTASLNTRILEQLIELNKDKLADLKAGKHTLLVSPDGKLSIIGNQNLLLNQPQRNVAETKEIEGFNLILLPSKAILNIETKKTMLDHKDILVSTNKIIKQKRNGVLYKVNYLTNGIYHEDVHVTYSSNVPKGKYLITQDALTKFYVNGSETFEKKTQDIIEEGKFSKRIPTIITRTTILTSGIFWGALRAIEYLRIP